MENIDIREVIGRLKHEMKLESDADLARNLDIERTYLGAMKSRGDLLALLGMQFSIFVERTI